MLRLCKSADPAGIFHRYTVAGIKYLYYTVVCSSMSTCFYIFYNLFEIFSLF